MNSAASPTAAGALWTPEYERLTIHGSSCPTCTAVDNKGFNRRLPCAEDERVAEAHRRAKRA